MSNKINGIALVVLIVAGALILRSIFPRIVTEMSPPRITAVHDTVQKVKYVLDSAALARAIAALKPDTIYLEHWSVTPAETIRVAPPLLGLTALFVAPKVGDSTVAVGFQLVPLADSGYTINSWRAQYYTPGPLRALALNQDGNLRLAFAFPPPKGCGLFCKLGHYTVGAAGGYAACRIGL